MGFLAWLNSQSHGLSSHPQLRAARRLEFYHARARHPIDELMVGRNRQLDELRSTSASWQRTTCQPKRPLALLQAFAYAFVENSRLAVCVQVGCSFEVHGGNYCCYASGENTEPCEETEG